MAFPIAAIAKFGGMMQNSGMGLGGQAQIPATMFQAGLGLSQALKARKLGRTPRPAFEIPKALQENIDIARGLTLGQMPGLGIGQQQIGANTAAGYRQVMDAGVGGAEKMAAIAGLNAGANDALTNLAMQNAQYQVNQQQNLQQALGQIAPYQMDQFSWNKQQPYLNAMAAAQRLRDAANTNIYGSLVQMGNIAALKKGVGDTNTGVAGQSGMTQTPQKVAGGTAQKSSGGMMSGGAMSAFKNLGGGGQKMSKDGGMMGQQVMDYVPMNNWSTTG
jgi:hypothetical protein